MPIPSAQYDFLIVEDELLIAEMIAEVLESAGYTHIRKADSVDNAIKEIEHRAPTLILTDIALGKSKTGIDLGRLLHSKYHIPFIYVTSHSSSEILGQAKHTHPNAYIVKPFKAEDLQVAIEFALFNAQNNGKPAHEKEELIVKEGRAIVKLPHENILFFEANGNYTNIVMSSGKKRMVRTPISEFETQLNGTHFMRIHKSFIVNGSFVKEVTASTVKVMDQDLPVGRTYQASAASLLKTRK